MICSAADDRALRFLFLERARPTSRASAISRVASRAAPRPAPPGAATRCGQRGVDLLGVGQTQRDLLAPRLEHLQHRLVGEPVEQRADDREADDLRRQVRPVHAERPGDLFDLPAARPASAVRERHVAHSSVTALGCRGSSRLPTSRGTARRTRSLRRTRWPESTAPSPAWPSPDCVRPPPTPSCPINPTAEGRAQSRKPDVQVAGHMCSPFVPSSLSTARLEPRSSADAVVSRARLRSLSSWC